MALPAFGRGWRAAGDVFHAINLRTTCMTEDEQSLFTVMERVEQIEQRTEHEMKAAHGRRQTLEEELATLVAVHDIRELIRLLKEDLS